MPNIIPFVKMHGLGNDFVILKESDIKAANNHSQLIELCAQRRLGIGCDQIIFYEQITDSHFNMRIFNNDGSPAKACGNATRCLSRLIFEEAKVKNITIQVAERLINCTYHNNQEICVDMGSVSFEESWMPNNSDLWSVAQQYNIEPKELICVDVANPHLVIFSKLSSRDQKIIGENFQKSPLFANGVNVNFAEIIGENIKLRVWERGAGFTNACGSGAIATFAAANKLNFVQAQSHVIFDLGKLLMRKESSHITMTGPASLVFRGELYL